MAKDYHNKTTYQYLSQAEKDSIDMLEPTDMLGLLKDDDIGNNVLFLRVWTVLANMVRDGMRLNDDQKVCLMLPIQLWGGMMGLELYKLKQKKDEHMSGGPPKSKYKALNDRDVPF